MTLVLTVSFHCNFLAASHTGDAPLCCCRQCTPSSASLLSRSFNLESSYSENVASLLDSLVQASAARSIFHSGSSTHTKMRCFQRAGVGTVFSPQFLISNVLDLSTEELKIQSAVLSADDIQSVLLLENVINHVSAVNPLDGCTCVHYAVESGDNVSLVTMLLSADSAVANVQDKSGLTPLHVACKLNRNKLVQMLVVSISSCSFPLLGIFRATHKCSLESLLWVTVGDPEIISH